MTSPSRAELLRVRKLAGLPEEIRKSRWGVTITRLTVLKSLCQAPDVANRFVAYLANKTFDRVEQGRRDSAHANASTDEHRSMMTEALEGMEAWQQKPTEALKRTLTALLGRMRAEQNEYRNIPYGAVRLITDGALLLFEYTLSCLLAHEAEVGSWVYQVARQYAERYDSSQGTGLITSSIPLVQDIADFWVKEFEMTPESLVQSAPKARAGNTPQSGTGQESPSPPRAKFTPRQGQFLAFIHLYLKLHRRGPAETDLVKFFRVTAPAAHGMVIKLEDLGLITREPGVARSVRVAVPLKQLPELEEVDGPPW